MENLVIRRDECQRFVASAVEKIGCPVAAAGRWSELLVQSSLLGFDTHGIRMLDRYIRFAEGGGIDPRAEPTVVREEGGCVSIDGRNAFGHLAADRATALALERAETNGIACVTVKNCNHVGACGVYVLQAAEHDHIGICTTISRAGMAPWGGKTALLGLDPLAISAPAGDASPFLLDFATSMTAMGSVTKAADLGQSISEGLALDEEGNPTTDPHRAIRGSLLPVGAHKGYALAMAVEILSALLSGGELAPRIRSWIQQTEEPMGASFTFIAIRIAAFQEPEIFKQRLRGFVETLTSSPVRDGFDRIYYPGEMEGEVYARRAREGIPIDQRTAGMFRDLAGRLGIQNPGLEGT